MAQQQQLASKQHVNSSDRVRASVALAIEEAARWDRVIEEADPALVRSSVQYFRNNKGKIDRFPTIYLRLGLLHEHQARQARALAFTKVGRFLGRMFGFTSRRIAQAMS